MEQVYSIQYQGDDKLEEFARHWQELTEDTDLQMSDKYLYRLLYGKLFGKTEIMKGDLDYLSRLDEGHADCTHAYLFGRMWYWIKKMKDNSIILQYNTEKGKMLGAPPLQGGVLTALKQSGVPALGAEGSGGARSKSAIRKEKKKQKQALAAAERAKSGGAQGSGQQQQGQGVPPPPPPPALTATGSTSRTKKQWIDAELAKICLYHQTDSCWRGSECNFKHDKVPKNLHHKLRAPSSGPKGSGKRGKS